MFAARAGELSDVHGEGRDSTAGIEGFIEGGVQQDCIRPNRG